MSKRDRAVVAMYKKGRHLRDVADEFEVSHETVRNILKRHDIPIRRVGRPRAA